MRPKSSAMRLPTMLSEDDYASSFIGAESAAENSTETMAEPEADLNEEEPEAEQNEDEPEAAPIEEEPKGKRKKGKRKKGKRKTGKRKRQEDGDIEEEDETVSGDDCEVAGDEDCNEVRYADGDHGAFGVEEEHCGDFVAEFGDAAREEESGDDSDAGSGDDIWDDERIPEPLSHSDDEEAFGDEDVAPPVADDPEEILRVGKTFNSPEDFKIALLRYSLKTRYNIRLYRSEHLVVGAKCANTDKDVKCE